jgi:hypothetical protein
MSEEDDWEEDYGDGEEEPSTDDIPEALAEGCACCAPSLCCDSPYTNSPTMNWRNWDLKQSVSYPCGMTETDPGAIDPCAIQYRKFRKRRMEQRRTVAPLQYRITERIKEYNESWFCAETDTIISEWTPFVVISPGDFVSSTWNPATFTLRIDYTAGFTEIQYSEEITHADRLAEADELFSAAIEAPETVLFTIPSVGYDFSTPIAHRSVFVPETAVCDGEVIESATGGAYRWERAWKWRFFSYNPETGNQDLNNCLTRYYTVEWDEVFFPADGGDPDVEHKSEIWRIGNEFETHRGVSDESKEGTTYLMNVRYRCGRRSRPRYSLGFDLWAPEEGLIRPAGAYG